MPIYWQYLLSSFFRIFSLSVGAFMSIAIVSKFKEIARFAALSGSLAKSLIFALYQIPTILPTAIPLSCAIASFLLFQNLSQSHELTAFRALGLSLRKITLPLLIAGGFLTVATLSISSELSPYCRLATKQFLYRETTTNPLQLLQMKNLIKNRKAYFRLTAGKNDRCGKDFLFASFNPKNEKITFMMAQKLIFQNETLFGKNVSVISHLPSKESLDPLFIENQSAMSTSPLFLTKTLIRHCPKVEKTALPTKLLKFQLNENAKTAKKAFVEILRRISFAISAFSFSFLGLSFGCQQGRRPKTSIILPLFLILSVFLSYFLGKSSNFFPLTILIFAIPHLFIWMISFLRLKSLSKGMA